MWDAGLYQDVLSGIQNLMLNKLRSFLTMLGIVFGVASVIAMLSIGEGASKQALDDIRKLGSTNIIVSGVKPIADEAPSTKEGLMSVYGLLYADEARVAESFDAVSQVVPVKRVRKEGRLHNRVMELRLVGTTANWFDLVERELLAGRRLAPHDIESHASVCVLTEYGARRLLATRNTIGETLRLDTDYFEVIGIVKSDQGQSGDIQTPDEKVDAYIPLSVARTNFGDQTMRVTSGTFEREYVELHQLIIRVKDNSQVEPTALGIRTMLERYHKNVDYAISVPLTLLRQAEATRRTYNIVLGSIAAISLIVGGIGIMNIMLASVTERTREIGVRRAIGAKRKEIVLQFLIETVVLAMAGGLIGIGIGIVIPWLVTVFTDMPTVVTATSIGLSAGISVAIGVIFGLYPAVRAANLDPITALRHE